MESAKKGKAEGCWTTESVDGALLFVLFKDRHYHPDRYSVVSIYDNPLLPFNTKYNKRNFTSACQKAAIKCKQFQRNRTGVSQTFREFVKEARVQYGDVLASLTVPDYYHRSSSLKDESYIQREDCFCCYIY
mmetsp:Transcript_11226/g.10901  ORF Transcript_11226/g.10901 Transcript_11226/m.10901 type:complete len:132 (-) Transcript_11226:258-653(-)